MPIVKLVTDQQGEVGNYPRRCKLLTTDSLTIVMNAGYLNTTNLLGAYIYPTDIFDVIYNYVKTTGKGTHATLQANKNGTVVSLGFLNNAAADATTVPVTPGTTTTFTVTDAQVAANSVIEGNFATQTNAAAVDKITPANGSFTVTCSAAPGVSTFMYTVQTPTH